MKKMLGLTAFMIVGISVLTLYVSAQSSRGITIQGVGPAQPPAKEIVLLQALSQEEIYQEGVQIISQPGSGTTLRNGILKIEMTDGSVQQIPLLKVKKLRIETR
jgi:hypothetical protein